MILKIVLLAIIVWLIYRHWEGFQLVSAVFVVITAIIALEIVFYIYCAVHYISNLISRQKNG